MNNQTGSNLQKVVWSVDRNTLLIICLFGIIIIGSIWLYVWSMVETEYQAEVQHMEREGHNLAKIFEERTRRVIGTAAFQLAEVKDIYEQSGKGNEIFVNLMKYGRLAPGLYNLDLYDESGTLMATMGILRSPTRILQQEYFQVHAQQQKSWIFVGKPVVDPQSSMQTFPVSMRINKPENSFGGVIVANVLANNITSMFTEMDLGKEFLITLVGTDGIVRARQHRLSSENGQDISQSILLANARTVPMGSFTSFSLIDKVERMQCYRVLPEFNLIASVGIAYDDVLHRFRTRQQQYYYSAFTATLFMAVFCTLLLLRAKQQRILQNKLEKANSELERVNAELERLSGTDPMTGAWNRRSFTQAAESEIKRAQRQQHSLSLMMLDIDHFKYINDTYGHLIGDQVLIEFVKLIQSTLRDSDFLARVGGEEFAIIVPYAPGTAALEMAERIRKLIAEHTFDKAGVVTVSIGVAEYQSGNTIDIMMMKADQALYEAKNSARNCVCFKQSEC